jgi:hypothetical protein
VKRSKTRAALGPAWRLVEERPAAHADVLPPAAVWRGDEVVALWPDADPPEGEPARRWISPPTGCDALFLFADLGEPRHEHPLRRAATEAAAIALTGFGLVAICLGAASLALRLVPSVV